MDNAKVIKNVDKIVAQVSKRRQELCLSQELLAKTIGVSRPCIINLEKKRQHLRYDKMILLTHILGIE